MDILETHLLIHFAVPCLIFYHFSASAMRPETGGECLFVEFTSNHLAAIGQLIDDPSSGYTLGSIAGDDLSYLGTRFENFSLLGLSRTTVSKVKSQI
jgi:hypothetical protein